ncbi:MarR family winged helix-turn-helix transcriptional regulator [Mycolicibacterium diernhoferi]|nr:MarR family winged helix-turn-helix transcriptional regulator [Mycolicibacterium diernhoferi]QYL24824.1 MarR family winged helix-turn-helix transcriptional regulator [Mycolicibacterium diernhoferi]
MDDTTRIRDLAVTLHDLSWRISRFAPAQVGLDPLPASELLVLRAVMDDPGRSVSEVATAVAMQPSNVSAAVRGLCGRGLLEKRVDPADRRVSLLHPTARASGDRTAIEDVVVQTVTAALAELPREAIELLLTATPTLRELAVQVAATRVSAI